MFHLWIYSNCKKISDRGKKKITELAFLARVVQCDFQAKCSTALNPVN
jgi:hypothetical protein